VRAAVARLRGHPALGEVLRYLVAGTAITLGAHAIYLAGFALAMHPQLSWAVSYVCGIAVGYVVHGRYVFQAEARRHHWFTFPASYLFRFLIGEGLLWAAVAIGLSAGWAGFVTNLLLAPLGFVLLRLVLVGEALAWHSPVADGPPYEGTDGEGSAAEQAAGLNGLGRS